MTFEKANFEENRPRTPKKKKKSLKKAISWVFLKEKKIYGWEDIKKEQFYFKEMNFYASPANNFSRLKLSYLKIGNYFKKMVSIVFFFFLKKRVLDVKIDGFV